MSPEPQIGQPIPNAHLAKIDERKFTRYALDPDSDGGKDKAVVFKSALGFERDHWEILRDRIITDLHLRPVTGASSGPYTTFEVLVLIDGLNGRRAWVVTAWEMRDGVPWLATLRVATNAWQKRLDAAYPEARPGTS
ncbi:MAG: DUF6883 domain-containing protein [Solirubrobacteraceae bacterium]